MNTSQPTYDDILRLFQETARSFQETDRKFQETDRQIQEINLETNRRIKAVSKSIDRLGNRLGDFVKDTVRPAAVRLFPEQGIDVYEIHREVGASRAGDEIEIDLLVVNDTDVVAVECKSLLSIDDVKQHLASLNKLKRMLPTYADKKVMGAVAAMVLPDNVARYADRQGLYVIAQSGDHLLIRNDAKFKPQVW